MSDIDLIAVRGTMSDVMDGKTGEQRMYYVFDAMLDGTCTEEFQNEIISKLVELKKSNQA